MYISATVDPYSDLAQNLSPCFFKINFNIILQSIPVFQVITYHQVSRLMNPGTLYTGGWVDVRTDLNFAK